MRLLDPSFADHRGVNWRRECVRRGLPEGAKSLLGVVSIGGYVLVVIRYFPLPIILADICIARCVWNRRCLRERWEINGGM